MMERLPPNRLGERLKELRMGLGLSQRGLADLAGLTKSHVASIEQGKVDLPPRYKLYALAETLETTTADLLMAAGYLEEPATIKGVLPELLNLARKAPRDLQRQMYRMLRTALQTRE